MKSVPYSCLMAVSQGALVGLILGHVSCLAAVAESSAAGRSRDFNPPPQPTNVVFSEFQATAPECPNSSLSTQQPSSILDPKILDPKILDPKRSPQALLPVQLGGFTYLDTFPVYFLIPTSVQSERSASVSSTSSSLGLFVELSLRDRSDPTAGSTIAPNQTPLKIPIVTAKKTGYSKLDLSKLDLSRTQLRLEADRLYQWSLTGMCPDQKQTYTLSGWIKRVMLPAELEQALMGLSPEKKVMSYSQYGLWYDAVAEAIALAEAGNPEPLRSLLKHLGRNSPSNSPDKPPVP